MEKYGYRKTFEKTFVRRKHLIKFESDATAGNIMSILNSVPVEAEIDEVMLHDNGDVSIVFHEERFIS